MGRPRCDPFDAAAIIVAIGKGETTPLRAYQAYASTAARPYSRASFELNPRRYERLGQTPAPQPVTSARRELTTVRSRSFCWTGIAQAFPFQLFTRGLRLQSLK